MASMAGASVLSQGGLPPEAEPLPEAELADPEALMLPLSMLPLALEALPELEALALPSSVRPPPRPAMAACCR